jgi:myo-inositol-1(or 4)-monophosphatase
VAAGSLMITEAGGLVGNFTGEADFLYQREVVAATPRIYGQLVQMLTPYTRVIREAEEAGAGVAAAQGTVPSPDASDATQAFTQTAAPAAPARKATRVRKADLPTTDDAPF